jgi:hypothetical protein
VRATRSGRSIRVARDSFGRGARNREYVHHLFTNDVVREAVVAPARTRAQRARARRRAWSDLH